MPDQDVGQLFDLAVGEQRSGRLREAEALYRRVLSVDPNHLRALQNLAFNQYQNGNSTEAAELLRRVIALVPGDANLLNNLGSVLAAAGKLDEAAEAFRSALSIVPDSPQIRSNLGNALQATGRLEEAICEYRQALSIQPDFADAHNNVGTALGALSRLDHAIEAFRAAVKFKPGFPQAWNNLGTALREKGELDESIDACRRALAIDPNFLTAHHSLGNTYRDGARHDEAIACYRKAASTQSDVPAEDDLLLAMMMHPAVEPRQLWGEYVRWNQMYARPLLPAPTRHTNDRSSERRLRIGYVSPDFREHPVGRLILPVVAHHDHRDFEIICYSDVRRADGLTQAVRSKVDQWRETFGIPDEQLAQLVRADRIDVLVDLAMHTKNNRLLMFARKPAPVQVCYLAYPGTTGLEAMDYRMSDPFLDPARNKGDIPDFEENRNVPFTAERSMRLARTFWCYAAPAHAPDVNALPAISSGSITFGCLNLYSKVTAPMLYLWAKLLKQVSNSRLILHSFRGSHREKARDIFAAEGVERDRVEFVDRVAAHEYFQQYHRIDIALDTFPYPGGTTTCDALWMGVPVVTLAGETALSRGGVSILSNIGLNEFIAGSPQHYLQIARDLAVNLGRLKELRPSLRERMQSSALMDAAAFVGDVEAAYRSMWRSWCRDPDDIEPLNRRAQEAYQRREMEEALHYLNRLILIEPQASRHHSNLAMVLAAMERSDEAAAALRHAIQLQPDNAEAWNNLGNVLQRQSQYEPAADAYRRALRALPHFPVALANLASALRDLGQLDEVIELYRVALKEPIDPEIAHNFLLTLHFHSDTTPQLLRDEHARWNQKYARSLMTPRRHSNPPAAERRLRIGYVSPEFNAGPTGRFLLPLLECRDRESFEVICYSSGRAIDEMAGRFKASCDLWAEIFNLDDQLFVQRVLQDQIDVLVDCAKHTRDNRLLAFARKPAPVQVTYLPYCSTTGLETIDYRVTDPYLDPVGTDEGIYSERSVRLPRCYWCYLPPVQAPTVESLPALANGFVTFGCFNSYLKVSVKVLSTWAELLGRVPRSQLVITCRPGSHRGRARELFSSAGIDAGRLQFVDHQPADAYFRQYQQIDIALDPFPYGGGTTTCDALWMGVPVVSLTGPTAVSRAGLSILSNVGLGELVARDVEQYLQIAHGLATDLPRLRELRATMRQRMQDSPLMNVRQFTADFEAALRAMWREWCRGQQQVNA